MAARFLSGAVGRAVLSHVAGIAPEGNSLNPGDCPALPGKFQVAASPFESG